MPTKLYALHLPSWEMDSLFLRSVLGPDQSRHQPEHRVYAEGIRADEMPIALPECELIDRGAAVILSTRCRKRRRKMFRKLNHCAIPGYGPICVDTNDPLTIECSLKKRLMRTLPTPDPQWVRGLMEFTQKFCEEYLDVVTPLSFDEWLDTLTFSEERKDQLREAHDQLRGGRPRKRTCKKVKAFMKTEFYPSYKHGRMINSRVDEFKVFSGPFFKAIEREVYSLPWFIKHVPVPERPALIKALRKAGRRYFITDFTSFEASFIPAVMEAMELVLYRYCLGGTEEGEFICNVISGKNKLKMRCGTKAQLRGRRMSGDMCTSLGNGFSNLMLALYLNELNGGSINTIDGYVEGDDGIFALEHPLSKDDYAKLGFDIKITEISDPCVGTPDANFCGLIFSDSNQIIRNPHKFLQGFGWTSSFTDANQKIMDQLLRAKSLSAIYETPQCPVIGALARLGLRLTRGVVPRFVNDGYHFCPSDEIPIPAYEPSIDTRQLFQEVYGISVQDQIMVEGLIESNKLDGIQAIIQPNADVSSYCLNYIVEQEG